MMDIDPVILSLTAMGCITTLVIVVASLLLVRR